MMEMMAMERANRHKSRISRSDQHVKRDGYAVKISLSDHLRQLEEQLLDPVLRKNREHVANLLIDDFVEFGASGRIFHKEDILPERRGSA